METCFSFFLHAFVYDPQEPENKCICSFTEDSPNENQSNSLVCVDVGDIWCQLIDHGGDLLSFSGFEVHLNVLFSHDCSNNIVFIPLGADGRQSTASLFTIHHEPCDTSRVEM